MQGTVYRAEIRKIVRGVIKKKFPGIKSDILNEVAKEIAVNVHARLYGAAVDDVASPIWRDDNRYAGAFSDAKPNKTAQELLDSGMAENLGNGVNKNG